ncbi:WS/DGAT domain-containing protein [Nocardia miyunensis]|uniref:WS/DGAT domain-containing protein n=1 Tax=Nocardia miyunensis TaxID=282684 RepID=UPI00082E0F3C|nr:WS/DGAT domain-containing protein [Nocardia miyunensis]
MSSLAPQDATRHWLSRRTVNDLFLLYCFTDAGHPSERLRGEVLARAASIPDLCVRLRENRFAYPEWVRCTVTAEQITEPALLDPSWPNVIAALEDLLSHGVRADEHPWRLYLFRGVRDAPGCAAPALVAVLQLSHALADGRRAAQIARALWSDASTEPDAYPPPLSRGVAQMRDAIRSMRGVVRRSTALLRKSAPIPLDVPIELARKVIREAIASLRPLKAVSLPIGSARKVIRRRVVSLRPVEVMALLGMPVALARTVIRGFAAERARRGLEELTTRGEIDAPATEFPPTLLNHPPAPSAHAIRMLVREDLRVPGRTVTVVAASAIAQALSRYLAERGEPGVRLGAQVSMALPAADRQPAKSASRRRRPRNNYVDLAIELPVDEPDPHRRADRITTALTARRTRATHPLMTTRNAVTEVIPAPLLRRDIAGYPLDLSPDTLSGHTVISSVNRGPADLTFGGAPAHWTAGFPALGTVMHLTHGIHGLGDKVTVSIHADPAVIPDIDVYADLLNVALTETVSALRR